MTTSSPFLLHQRFSLEIPREYCADSLDLLFKKLLQNENTASISKSRNRIRECKLHVPVTHRDAAIYRLNTFRNRLHGNWKFSIARTSHSSSGEFFARVTDEELPDDQPASATDSPLNEEAYLSWLPKPLIRAWTRLNGKDGGLSPDSAVPSVPVDTSIVVRHLEKAVQQAIQNSAEIASSQICSGIQVAYSSRAWEPVLRRHLPVVSQKLQRLFRMASPIPYTSEYVLDSLPPHMIDLGMHVELLWTSTVSPPSFIEDSPSISDDDVDPLSDISTLPPTNSASIRIRGVSDDGRTATQTFQLDRQRQFSLRRVGGDSFDQFLLGLGAQACISRSPEKALVFQFPLPDAVGPSRALIVSNGDPARYRLNHCALDEGQLADLPFTLVLPRLQLSFFP